MTTYEEIVTDNSDRAIEAYQLWMQSYPRDEIAPVNLAVLYLQDGDSERYMQFAKKAHELDSSTLYTWMHLISAYTMLNRFDEARDMGQQAIAHGFDAPGIHSMLMSLAIAQNDAPGIEAESRWLSQHAVQGVRIRQRLMEYAAAKGQLRRSEELTRRGAEELRSAGFPSAAADLLAAGATSQAMAGNTGRAREMASLAAQASTDRTTSLDLTLGYAYAGNFRQADALLDHLLRQYPESTSLKQVYAPDVRALEAIEEHKADAAISAVEGVRTFDFALPLSLPYVRGLALLAAHQTQQAIAEFQKIVDHPGVQAPSPVHSLAHLGLARSYAQAGDKEKALTAYQDFFALWKEADADVPLLQQAKAEYAKLK